MIRREEEEYPSQQVGGLWISQEEPPLPHWKQVLLGATFLGFIIMTPTLIEKLGKGPPRK